EAFKVLGLDQSATPKQIKDRFRELILKYHPDKNSDPESEEMTKKIIASYEFIQSKVTHA
ncbi:MAG: DnaJ domain-containing protein, partial [Candidatus Nitrosopelagicus sp.]|nr:DnaJ domain-containing protein [Candidatus Nitrosopelagicus sp.]